MKRFFSSQHPGGKVSLGSLSQRVVQGQPGFIQKWRPQHVVVVVGGGLTNGVTHEADAPSSVVYQAVQQKVTGSKVE